MATGVRVHVLKQIMAVEISPQIDWLRENLEINVLAREEVLSHCLVYLVIGIFFDFAKSFCQRLLLMLMSLPRL